MSRREGGHQPSATSQQAASSQQAATSHQAGWVGSAARLAVASVQRKRGRVDGS